MGERHTSHTVATITFRDHQVAIDGYLNTETQDYDWYDLYDVESGICLNLGTPLHHEDGAIQEVALAFLERQGFVPYIPPLAT